MIGFNYIHSVNVAGAGQKKEKRVNFDKDTASSKTIA